MSWNYRILAHEYKGEITLMVHEVHYTDDEPGSYSPTPAAIIGDTPEDMREAIETISRCFKKPILWAGEKFPQLYEPK